MRGGVRRALHRLAAVRVETMPDSPGRPAEQPEELTARADATDAASRGRTAESRTCPASSRGSPAEEVTGAAWWGPPSSCVLPSPSGSRRPGNSLVGARVLGEPRRPRPAGVRGARVTAGAAPSAWSAWSTNTSVPTGS